MMFELGSYEYFEDENIALLRHGPTGGHVLDVGCGSGVLGARLRARGNVVWGIDSADEVVGPATQRLDRFVQADVTDHTRISELLGDKRFDVIVFADVLEHLPDPIGTLGRYVPFLAPAGRVLVSVPNVAVWYVRLNLLLGRFDYTATGTLDRTHLRFFTGANLRRALSDAGLSVVEFDINPGIARAFVARAKTIITRGREHDRGAVLHSRAYRMYRRLGYPLEYHVCRLMPGLLAFQFVVVANAAQHRR